jgi:hypothetical protein
MKVCPPFSTRNCNETNKAVSVQVTPPLQAGRVPCILNHSALSISWWRIVVAHHT